MSNQAKSRASPAPLPGIAEYLSSLAERFPLLMGADGVRPWDPDAFGRWAEAKRVEAKRSRDADAERAWECALFVLAVATGCFGRRHARFSRGVEDGIARYSRLVDTIYSLGAPEREAIADWMTGSLLE